MEKLTQVKNYLLELAFIALLVRVVSVGCGVGEALALISVVSSMTYNKFLTKAKLEQYDELILKISSEKNELTAKIDAIYQQLTESHADLTARVGAIAMEKSIRRTNESQAPVSANTLVPSPGTTKRYF